MSTNWSSAGVLLRKSSYRDNDLVVTVFTPRHGRLTALARAARSSRKRFGGGLEPIHGLELEFSRGRFDRIELKSARVEVPRLRLTAELERLEAAGRALNWVRQACPENEPEPALWEALIGLLDALNEPHVAHPPQLLASAGLQLLGALGWGLDFEHCAACGRTCPSNRAACVVASRGGLICSSCGGGPRRLDAATRARLAAAAQGESLALRSQDARLALELIDEAFAAHANIG